MNCRFCLRLYTTTSFTQAVCLFANCVERIISLQNVINSAVSSQPIYKHTARDDVSKCSTLNTFALTFFEPFKTFRLIANT